VNNKPKFFEVFKCQPCGADGVALSVPQCVVGWCENGHVYVVSPNLTRPYKVVYDFREEDL
jgi:hypothetical protein